MKEPPPASLSEPTLQVDAPDQQRLPMVFASPHSGRIYSPAFLAQSALDPLTLRRSEDSYVDELYGAAPTKGAPLLKALFPRAFVDVNRAAYELDPTMFDGPLPDHVVTDTPRIAAGFGTIARQVANGAEIYRDKLSFAEAERRIETFYRPYHATLSELIEETLARFPLCALLDCHSMPSSGGASDGSAEIVDFVLGDCFGRSCGALLIDSVEVYLSELGYNVVRNSPYAGGHTTRFYGNPRRGVHALQIEVNRRLYMDEKTHQKLPGFVRLQDELSGMIDHLADCLKTMSPRC